MSEQGLAIAPDKRACGDRRDFSLSEPKNPRSKASIPVVKQLTESLEAHRKRMGKLAVGPIFQSGNGSPLDLDAVSFVQSFIEDRILFPVFNQRQAERFSSLVYGF